MRLASSLHVLALVLLGLCCRPASAQAPSVHTLPEHPLIERTRVGQQLNFDLIFENPGDTPLELVGLELTRSDDTGGFVGQRRLDQNGNETTMGIATVPNRALPARGTLVVFNPFANFAADDALDNLHIEAVFDAGEGAPERRVAIDVHPLAFQPRTPLSFPLRGDAFVHDGHDLTSHHRRIDVTGGMSRALGITSNFVRYANDFVVTDPQGRLFRTDGATPEDFYGYGSAVLAAGDGVVREVHDGMPDNRKSAQPPFAREAAMKNPKLLFGNYVLIDHGNGEYSVYVHLKQGSVAVAAGQRVSRGQQIGGMGMSGDAFLVHLHYQLQSGPGFEEGLPSYFENMQVRTGGGWSAPFDGPVDSGMVVRAAAK